jgi:hypothetical protein
MISLLVNGIGRLTESVKWQADLVSNMASTPVEEAISILSLMPMFVLAVAANACSSTM